MLDVILLIRMENKKSPKGFERLRLTSSGSKIFNQLMMFVVVGILPILFPQYIKIENRTAVFIIVSLALSTSIIFEIYKAYLEKKRKDTNLLLNIQLLTSVFLLTPFLFLFGRINGPFFVLYLLTIMESFLNLNIILSYVIVTVMMVSTTLEFIWLGFNGEMPFSFISIVGFLIRILSILFMSTYGYVLATKTIAEEKARNVVQRYAKNLEDIKNKLEAANEKLKVYDKQKDEFISMAAHELRSPMTAIKGYISMILEGDAGEISDKGRGYLTDAEGVTDRSIRLVNNMLNVTRIEEGRLVYQIEEVALIKAAQESYHSFGFEADRKGLEFKLNIADGIRDTVLVDPDRIREVIGNLVSNAIKFTETGKVEIRVTNPTHDKIKIEVIDTGPGISKKEQEKLFKKFYRVESTKGKTMGTGLGLYISRLLIEKFNGKIELDSDSGKGSNFWFELPLARKSQRQENQT